jgi:histidine decarboxylase
MIGREGIQYGPGGKQWSETLSRLAVSSKGKLLVSPPSRDPLSLQEYSRVSSHVTGSYYQVPSVGLSQEEQDIAHRETLDFLEGQAQNCMGYQCDLNMSHYQKTLPPYLKFLGNNVGDPFSAGTYTINTKWMECNVLDYFASLWNGKWPYKLEDPETYWGYVLTMGSTEGNLYAAWNARDYLSGRFLYYDPPAQRRAYEEIKSRKGMTSLPSGYTYGQARLVIDESRTEEQNENAFSPVVFYSEETHYSNFKATHAIGVPSFYSVAMEKYPGQCPLLESNGRWPPDVPCKDGALGPGSIDIDALAKLVDFFTAKGHPVFIILNYGSTFKGSYDDVELVGETLIPILKKNNMYERTIVMQDGKTEIRRAFWIHIDGALGAAYMPFVEMAVENGLLGDMKPGPKFDFRLDFVFSIVTSGHKWIGAPYPCGVYLTRNKYRVKPPTAITYIGSPDTTFSGSRSSLSCALLWTYISTHSYEAQVRKVLLCLDLTKYAYEKLKMLEKELKLDLWVTRSHEYALTVLFRRPNDKIVFKYILSSEKLLVNDGEMLEERLYSHIYLMEHITYAKIDELIEDLKRPGAFPVQDTVRVPENMVQLLDSHDKTAETEHESHS